MFDQNLIHTNILPLMQEVSAMCRRSFGSIGIVRIKGKRQLVNPLDIYISDFLVARLQELYPEFGILSEESQDSFVKKDFNWIIDPLDGSTNFSRNIPLFCSQIALEHRGEIIFACVVLPQEDKLIYAAAGQGVFCDGVPMGKINNRKLAEAVIVFDSYLEESDRRVLDSIVDSVQYMLNYNSVGTGFAYLVLGRIEGVLNFCDRNLKILPYHLL